MSDMIGYYLGSKVMPKESVAMPGESAVDRLIALEIRVEKMEKEMREER